MEIAGCKIPHVSLEPLLVLSLGLEVGVALTEEAIVGTGLLG